MCLIFACAHAQQLYTATVIADPTYNANTGTYRDLSVVATSSAVVVTGVKAKVADNTATYNAARFAAGNGDATKGPGFYLGVLAASASSTELDNTTIYGSISGAFAELLVGFTDVLVYYDRDGNPGFQYTLGTDPLCSDSTTTDCVETTDNYKLASLNWAALTYNVASCPSNYDAKCKVYSVTLVGTPVLTTSPLITLTYTIASHPLMLTYSNGQTVSITPDKGKIDVSITYPWASRTSTRANPQLAIIVAAAGRAGSGGVSGSVQVNGNSASLTWNSGVSATLFSWDTNAYIAAQANAVTSVTITAQQLDAYKCNSLLCIGIGDLLALSWKTYADIYALFGWDTRVVVFSWSGMPANSSVFWDPNLTNSNAFTTTFSLFSVLVAMLLHGFVL